LKETMKANLSFQISNFKSALVRLRPPCNLERMNPARTGR